jgi:hypothetical protein
LNKKIKFVIVLYNFVAGWTFEALTIMMGGWSNWQVLGPDF